MLPRTEFAIMMRAMARRKLDDSVFLHCSMRNEFLAKNGEFVINIANPRPFWATTTNDCCIINAEGAPSWNVQTPNSQWEIHRDIYAARPEFQCILHVHTAETIAVAMLGGIRQLHQGAALFTNDFMSIMSYRGLNRYDGLVENFGLMKYVVLMEGHGAMVAGRTPGEAFELLLNLQDVCRKELIFPTGAMSVFSEYSPSFVAEAHESWIKGGRPFGAHSWPAERDALYAELIKAGVVL